MDVAFSVSVFTRHLAVPAECAAAKVWLVGSLPELGAWDPTKAVPMELLLANKDETQWHVTVTLPTSCMYTPIEYKYIIKESDHGDVLSWEAMPGNRTATLTTATNLARGKPSTQSSTWTTRAMPCPGPRPSTFGNNGNRNGFQEWKCARTQRESYPWWSVDLEAEFPLTTLHLWTSQTYHDEFKREDAIPPVSVARKGETNSAIAAPPMWIFISSTTDLATLDAEELLKSPKSGNVMAYKLSPELDARVVTLNLEQVRGRYVRLQYETTKCTALHFAEVEVFGTGGEGNVLTLDDGYYGVESGVDGDLYEYIDSDWVDPTGDRAQVRLWIGSFKKDVPAIQWIEDPTRTRSVSVDMRYSARHDDVAGKHVWKPMPVDSRGAPLLDKESVELRKDLDVLQKQPTSERCLKKYVNSVLDAAGTFEDWLTWLTSTKTVTNGAAIDDLRGQVTTKVYQDGEVVLHYGEHRREAFFIRQGEVLVTGPPSTRGTVDLGTIAAGTALNDRALFSQWPERSATFRAPKGGRVEVMSLCYTALIRVLGVKVLCSLRRMLFREQNAHAVSEIMEKTNTTRFVDEDHAQVFRFRLPLSALTAATTPSLEHKVRLHFRDPHSHAELGTASLLPSQLSAHGEGFLTLPIVASGDCDVVGQVSLHYIIIRPFAHQGNTLARTWRTYWRERVPLNGGHRGMGRSFNQVGGFRKALTRENTLASFILAGRNGADFVEFDVQLSKDQVPVLYHDFILKVGIEDKRAWTQGAQPEQQEIGIHDLTLRQLTRCQTAAIPKRPMPKLKQLIKKHWYRILRKSPSIRVDRPLISDDDYAGDAHIVEFYPKLEELLKHVPPEVGLNVEIKYPDPIKRSAYRFSPPFEMNVYVDTILRCVFDHAHGRRIFFSCFDPTLVVLLRAKQATYPVFFLTYGRVRPPVVDARLTLQFAINFVKMERLRGIVSNSDEFLAMPECVELVKREKIVLMTWGDQNTSHECVQLQKRHAIDGIISDNIGDLAREDKKMRVQG